MGKDFYLIEYEKADTTRNVLPMNHLELRNARAFFTPWRQGFNVAEIVKKGEIFSR